MKFLKSKKSNKIRGAGFTIVEALVAISIFSIAVTGVITVASKGGNDTIALRNRLTANYLAQEGIELMRSKRDSYDVEFSSGGWTEFINGATGAGCPTECDIDVITRDWVPSPVSQLNYDGYIFSHSQGSTYSIFTRKISIVSVPALQNNEGITVTSTVTWLEGTVPRTISYSENLFAI